MVEKLVFEATAILLSSLRTIIVSFYRSPVGNLSTFLDKLHENLVSLHGVPFDIVLAGDFNLDILEYNNGSVMELLN